MHGWGVRSHHIYRYDAQPFPKKGSRHWNVQRRTLPTAPCFSKTKESLGFRRRCSKLVQAQAKTVRIDEGPSWQGSSEDVACRLVNRLDAYSRSHFHFRDCFLLGSTTPGFAPCAEGTIPRKLFPRDHSTKTMSKELLLEDNSNEAIRGIPQRPPPIPKRSLPKHSLPQKAYPASESEPARTAYCASSCLRIATCATTEPDHIVHDSLAMAFTDTQDTQATYTVCENHTSNRQQQNQFGCAAKRTPTTTSNQTQNRSSPNEGFTKTKASEHGHLGD